MVVEAESESDTNPVPGADRIAVLFMQSQEFFGADSQVHASIMRHLPRDRFEVHCAVPRQRDDGVDSARRAVSEIDEVRIRPTEFGPSLEAPGKRQLLAEAIRRGPSALASLIGLVRYARKNRIRVIHCTEKPRDAVYGTVVAALAGANCVVHVHVKAEDWIRPMVRRSMRRAAALVGVSEFVAQSLVDLGYDRGRIFVVRNGIELDDWIGAAPDTEGVREEFSLAADQPVIVSASRLFRYKGQHELIAAMPEVRRSLPDVRALIVGADDPRGAPGEGSYSAELRRLVDEFELDGCVVFTGWRHDVRALMAAGTVYCMPSFEEPFGMVFAEAMALGKPVVALNNGGTKEVVDDGQSGLLSEPGDVGSLARNLVELLSDDRRRQDMSAHARQRVVDHFGAERMAIDTAHVYEHLVGSPAT